MSAGTAKNWFRRVVWAGIAANLALAIPTIAAPSMMLELSGLPTATPELWVRFAGLLLVLLSTFYMPPAFDPDRYRAVAWLSVAARLAGVVFFLMEPAVYRPFALFDLTFFLPEALLLTLASRNAAGAPAPIATT
jgi:hypothetical protein